MARPSIALGAVLVDPPDPARLDAVRAAVDAQEFNCREGLWMALDLLDRSIEGAAAASGPEAEVVRADVWRSIARFALLQATLGPYRTAVADLITSRAGDVIEAEDPDA